MLNLNILEPITLDNLSELKEGDWIWDNKPIERRNHGKTFSTTRISEPIGFRQIDILDIEMFTKCGSKLFLLSRIDSDIYNPAWVYFESGRFYKFKNLEDNHEQSR